MIYILIPSVNNYFSFSFLFSLSQFLVHLKANVKLGGFWDDVNDGRLGVNDPHQHFG